MKKMKDKILKDGTREKTALEALEALGASNTADTIAMRAEAEAAATALATDVAETYYKSKAYAAEYLSVATAAYLAAGGKVHR